MGRTTSYGCDGDGIRTRKTINLEYDAFGALKSVTGTLANEFKFTGEQWDGDAGLYYL